MARAWPWSSSGCRTPRLLRTAHPDADLEGSLEDWRRFRKQKRTADIHWIDALYQAYLTGILGVVAVVTMSSLVGDDPLDASQLARLREHGPAWVGVLAAFAVALGLRSGSRGGPLALERADVRHVLLAPVDRTTALRAPVVRQLRFLAFVGLVAGAIAGDMAARRLPGSALAWVATDALAGVTLVGLGVGSALVAAGTRLPRWAASLVGLVLLALAAADGAGAIETSPTAPFGDLALWPLRFHLTGLLPIVTAMAVVLAGLALVGRVSIEAAERRSTLVGQLRFAATLQDLRTVIVLRRQLAMELPRLRPWVRLRVHGTGRAPVLVRGLRGILRWPAARVARLLLLGATAGLCLRWMWAGTTPVIVLAGLAVFVAGLDTVEPLAQEVDHPSRRDASPMDAAAIHVRHVPVGVLGQLVVAAVAVGVASIPGTGRLPADVALLGFVPLALGALAGALVSVLSAPVSTSGGWALAPPEAQGMRVALRTAWPPAIATVGVLPILLGRDAVEQGESGSSGAGPAAALVVALFALVCMWARVRDDMADWFRGQAGRADAEA